MKRMVIAAVAATMMTGTALAQTQCRFQSGQVYCDNGVPGTVIDNRGTAFQLPSAAG